MNGDLFRTGTRAQQFDAALAEVTKVRGEAYGHPLDDFAIASAIKLAVASCPHNEVRHAMEQIGVKMARLCHDPRGGLDSIIDIGGYARTICMVLDEEEKRDAKD